MEITFIEQEIQGTESMRDTKGIRQTVNRYLRASDIIRYTKPKIVYHKAGDFGVHLIISGIMEKEICESICKDIETRMLAISRTVQMQASEILTKAVNE